MTQPSFDVLTEPWIPVIRMDWALDELGILRCLEEAHTIREIRDPSPIVEFGLYRLLVAFVLDALILAGQRPQDYFDLRDLIEAGSFEPGLFRDYAQECGDVFDLFHPERPFLQTPMAGENDKPLAGMFPAVPSGTNAGHWYHVPEDRWEVTAREAARLLTTIAPFMTAGGAGLSPSINGSPGVYVLPVGRNLFETLVLSVPLRVQQEAGEGRAAWKTMESPGKERTESTTVEALTWRPRKIQLVAETRDSGELYVRKMKFGRGDSTRLTWIDANLAYKYEGERVTPVRMRESRPLWRDAGPLMLVRGGQHGQGKRQVAYTRPDAVGQAFEMMIDGVPASIQAYGMRTDMKMKVFEWTKAGWQVPAGLGRSTRLGSLVHHELDRAEQAAWALRAAVRSLFPRGGAGAKDPLRAVSLRSERAYWQGLERGFIPLADSFATLDPEVVDDPLLIEATGAGWREAIEGLALEQFELAAKDMDADGEALERLVKARSWLHSYLRKVLA